MKNTILINELLTILPHGYPFVLIDRVNDYNITFNNEWLQGTKNVSINEPFFQGHFPTNPIMPGVLLLEGLAQASGLLIQRILEKSGNQPKLGYVAGFDKTRFKKPVIPGDVLKYNVTLHKAKRGIARLHATASVETAKVAYTEILIAQIN